MSVEEIMACSEIKLLLLGDGKFAEIRNIRTPTLPGTWPCPTYNTRNGKTPHTETTTNKRKRTKTTCTDGRKPGSLIITRQAIKSSCETPTHSPEKVHNKLHHESVDTGQVPQTVFWHYTRFLGFPEFSGYHQWQQESQ